jgi:hypothetical protein
MQSRYIEIQTKVGDDNRRVTSSVLYPPIPRSLNDIYIITTPGDRIDLLAKKYYNDIGYWWIIAEANAIGKGTMVIPQGIQLRIPTDIGKIIQDYKDLNP